MSCCDILTTFAKVLIIAQCNRDYFLISAKVYHDSRTNGHITCPKRRPRQLQPTLGLVQAITCFSIDFSKRSMFLVRRDKHLLQVSQSVTKMKLKSLMFVCRLTKDASMWWTKYCNSNKLSVLLTWLCKKALHTFAVTSRETPNEPQPS